jgi:hypothetical protein
MKKILPILLILTVNSIFAEKITFPKPASVKVKNVQTIENKGVFTNVISEMEVEKITVQGQDFTALQMDGYVYHGEIGHPKLPAKTRLLEVPTDATVEIKILSSEYVDIDLSRKGYKNQLFPVQPPVRKSAKKTPQLVKNKTAYSQKSLTARDLVDVEHLGIAKDRQLAQINICPVQYLPAKNLVRVHYMIEYEILVVAKKNSPQPKNILGAKIYQIISDRKFENSLIPFVAWKTEKGFDVRAAYTDQMEVGNTTASIKSYLTSIYNSLDRADYLLLVGDVQEIPAFPTSFSNNHALIDNEPHITDLYYAEYTGDYLPDVYYGRLSARNTQDLNNQIEKILAMEQLSVPSIDFLNKSLLIAGTENDPAYAREAAILNACVAYAEDYYFNAENGVNATVLYNPQ